MWTRGLSKMAMSTFNYAKAPLSSTSSNFPLNSLRRRLEGRSGSSTLSRLLFKPTSSGVSCFMRGTVHLLFCLKKKRVLGLNPLGSFSRLCSIRRHQSGWAGEKITTCSSSLRCHPFKFCGGSIYKKNRTHRKAHTFQKSAIEKYA